MKSHPRIFLVLSVLLLAALACSNLTAAPAADKDPNLLFQDDFSSTSSGWDSIRDDEGITDYENGGYRIHVLKPNFDYWANPGLTFTDVDITVETTKLAGPDENDFGIICRYVDENNYYFFIAANDGYYGIGRVSSGSQEVIGSGELQFSEVINQGDSAKNTVRAVCQGANLSLYVNGTLLADVQDSTFTQGDVGLLAGTFDEPGTDILFDNFVVRKP